jgi:hypothetical protein
LLEVHNAQKTSYITASVEEYTIPPIQDMLVLGKNAPIGCVAMRRALGLLIKVPFEHIEIEDDDTISDILVRQPVLRRVGQEKLISYVLTDPYQAADGA